jgi:hypothetical protein
MSLQAVQPRTSLVEQLARALEGVAEDENVLARRRAYMYAEAVDEADEADAMFRFGVRLRACLAPLGLELSSRGIGVVTATTSAVAA